MRSDYTIDRETAFQMLAERAHCTVCGSATALKIASESNGYDAASGERAADTRFYVIQCTSLLGKISDGMEVLIQGSRGIDSHTRKVIGKVADEG